MKQLLTTLTAFLGFLVAPAIAATNIGSMNPDGTGQSLIYVDAGAPTGVNWSPDKTKIVFSSRSSGYWEVYEYGIVADQLCKLTNYNDSYGQWGGRYLDNNRIWYRYVGGGGAQFEYRELVTSGCSVISETTLFSNPGWQLTTFDLSSDSIYYAVQTGSNGNTEEVFKAPITNLANYTQITTNSVPDRSPDASAFGSKIVYLESYGASLNNNVYVMNNDGSNKIQITFEPSGSIYSSRITYPQWSNDGSQIGYSRWDGTQWDIFVVPSDGSGSPVNVTNTPTQSERVWDWRDGKMLFTTTGEIVGGICNSITPQFFGSTVDHLYGNRFSLYRNIEFKSVSDPSNLREEMFRWEPGNSQGRSTTLSFINTGTQIVTLEITNECSEVFRVSSSINVSPIKWAAVDDGFVTLILRGLRSESWTIGQTTTISYSFYKNSGSDDIAGDLEWDEIRRAMDLWESITYSFVDGNGQSHSGIKLVQFEPSSRGSANIHFKGWKNFPPWDTDRGQCTLFMGGLFPNRFAISFSNRYTWSLVDDPNRFTRKLFATAVHEIGHALGMGEFTAFGSDYEDNMMHQSRNSWQEQLGFDDISALWWLYGPMNGDVAASVSFTADDGLPFKNGVNPSIYSDIHTSWKTRRIFSALSPVSLSIISPSGDSLSTEYSSIDSAYTTIVDVYGDSTYEKFYDLPTSDSGVYLIRVEPDSGTSYDDVYSIVVSNFGIIDTIVFAEFVGNIPHNGYLYSTLDTGSIVGVVIATGIGLLGTPVDLYDTSSAVIASSVTDENGHYVFAGLNNGEYTVSISTPLGYQALEETKDIEVRGLPHEADFDLTQLAIVPQQRSRGYWKHEISHIIKNIEKNRDKSTDYSATDMIGFINLIDQHFTQNRINPIPIYDGSMAPTMLDSLKALKELLSGKEKDEDRPENENELLEKYRKSKAELAALMLNVVSGKLSQAEVISADGVNVSQAITYSWMLLHQEIPCVHDDDGEPESPWECRYELAKKILKKINHGKTLKAGMIPLDTDFIAYKSVSEESVLPEEFGLYQNHPNPFNPSTKISLNLPEASAWEIVVYNIQGQKVDMYSGNSEPGVVTIEWDGSAYASGVYFYKVTAGDFTATKKMVLLK